MDVYDLTDEVELIEPIVVEYHPIDNDDLGPCWLED
jgi:hypothetical protein